MISSGRRSTCEAPKRSDACSGVALRSDTFEDVTRLTLRWRETSQTIAPPDSHMLCADRRFDEKRLWTHLASSGHDRDRRGLRNRDRFPDGCEPAGVAVDPKHGE